MQPMQILVLGPEGAGRSALEKTLTRLGYVVRAAEARRERTPPASGDIVIAPHGHSAAHSPQPLQ